MTLKHHIDREPSHEREDPPREIERKFHITTPPDDLDTHPHHQIRQGYLSVDPDGSESRIRQTDAAYFQTEKKGKGLERTEVEEEISKSEFDALWEKTQGRRVDKVRYQIPYGEYTIECDVYGGNLLGLVVAEVEFPSRARSDSFIPPDWFAREVTDDVAYKNQSLATQGLPIEIRNSKENEIRTIPEYNLKNGIPHIIEQVDELVAKECGPVICCIAGGSASGKTSAVAVDVLENYHGDATLLSIDDYYKGKTFMQTQAREGNELNWDQPQALDLELLMLHLKELKNGESILKPTYSMKTGEPVGTEVVHPNTVIIIEGLFALNESLKDVGDVNVFVDIGTHGRIVRRLLRDVSRTGQKPEEILKYFSEVVEPMHEKYIQNTRSNADIIINNEYSPHVEAQRSGLHEVQVKYTSPPDADTLRKLGAERLASVVQTDYYYNPKDRDLVDTDEMLRIRDEADRHILTYKGPRDTQSEYRKRPKFEFEIDGQTKDAFLGIYGEMVKKIGKERTLYQLDGVTFSIDHVYSEDHGDRRELGTFIELRGTTQDDEHAMRSVIKKLGLESSRAITESYFELASQR